MTNKTEKAVNYTDEQVATVVEMYKGDNSVLPAISEAVGKSVPSIRAKLSNLGLYQKAEAPAKRAGSTKADIVAQIATAAGLDELEAEGLAKATRGPLDKVLASLVRDAE